MSALPLVVVAGLVLALMATPLVASGGDAISHHPGGGRSRVRLVATAGVGLLSALAWRGSLLVAVAIGDRAYLGVGY